MARRYRRSEADLLGRGVVHRRHGELPGQRRRPESVDELYAELSNADVLHPVSKGGVEDTDFGTHEFSALDLDGNLIGFFTWVEP